MQTRQKMKPHPQTTTSRCVAAAWATFFVAAAAVSILTEMAARKYTPENNADILALLSPPASSLSSPSIAAVANKNSTVLACITMLTSDFSYYAAGALKMGSTLQKREVPALEKLGIYVQLAVLEMQEKPIPADIWMDLQANGGWQKRITRPRIPPRHEGLEFSPAFVDQFTKLQLWNLTEYDYVLYMDSDIFLLRSLVPTCILPALLPLEKAGMAAVRDVGSFSDAFNAGMFLIRPSEREFEALLCKLYGKQRKGCAADAKEVAFSEPWMEQGFLNAVYVKNWTEMPATCAMNLATLDLQPTDWETNQTRMCAIHFTMVKPWNWLCKWHQQYAHLCYLFWNAESLQFHRVSS